jgi:DNA-binding NarL/FixJ family response regulator
MIARPSENLFNNCFKLTGWEVCGQAENGLVAVSMAAELQPDVVILDLAMPSMDGLTAARKISESLPTVPIVMHTLHDLPQLELEAKKNGVRCVVPKSENARIISVLEELISDPASTASPQVSPESVTVQIVKASVTESTLLSIETPESKSCSDPNDIAKAS